MHLELLGVVGRAVIVDPEAAGRELVEAEHVHDADRGQAGAEQVGPFAHDGADEQPAVAAALNGQLRGLRVFLGDEILGRGDEVLVRLGTIEPGGGAVPVPAIFAAAAQVGHREHAAHLHPGELADAELRRQADVEAAVAVQQRRVGAVELDAPSCG